MSELERERNEYHENSEMLRERAEKAEAERDEARKERSDAVGVAARAMDKSQAAEAVVEAARRSLANAALVCDEDIELDAAIAAYDERTP